MVEKIAALFPGQGSQQVGMGKDLCERWDIAKDTFAEADEALGFGLTELCFEGPADQLMLTANTQPAILTMSIACWRILESAGLKPDAAAGHSLGEYSAFVASGALPFADAVRIVRARGTFMQEAVPVGVGAMAAIMGVSAETVGQICHQAAEDQVLSPANFNSPVQTVIAGHAEAVDRAVVLGKEKGAKRSMKLPVSAPFHCELMMPAQERLSPILEETLFDTPVFPVVNNVDGVAVMNGEEARAGLVRQVSGAVRWVDCMETLMHRGTTTYLEIGPGKVLGGLARRTCGDAKVAALGTADGIENYLKEMS